MNFVSRTKWPNTKLGGLIECVGTFAVMGGKIIKKNRGKEGGRTNEFAHTFDVCSSHDRSLVHNIIYRFI